MSIQAMTWAVEQDLPALQKLVLLMLANCSNHHTGQCNPSHDRLAKECGMSKDSVKRAISELAEKGYLEIQRKVKDGVNLPNQYNIKVGASIGVVGADSTEVGAVSGGRVGADSTTKQEVKPGKETEDLLSEFEDSKQVAKEVIEYLNVKANRSFRCAEANTKLVLARVKDGATIDQLKAVIDAKVKEWGEDPKMAGYLRPETLFRAGKFEQYVGAIKPSEKPGQTWWQKAGFEKEWQAVNEGCNEYNTRFYRNGVRIDGQVSHS